LLLLGNTGLPDYPIAGDFLWTYWFVDAYAQIILLVVGLFLIAPLRRWIAHHPLTAGLIATALALPLRWYGPILWDAGPMKAYMTISILYMPALGWAIWFAETRAARWILTGVALTVLPLASFASLHYLEPWVRCGLVICAALLLIWRVNVPLPGFAAALVRRVSAASYHIYLFHVIPMHVFFQSHGHPAEWHPGMRFAAGLACGLLAFQADRWIRRQIPALLAGARRQPQPAE
jgi:peptidoglycan/LPS O-acetylase OafA/YrhL